MQSAVYQLAMVKPLPPKQARALYQQDDDDRREVGKLIAAQRFDVED